MNGIYKLIVSGIDGNGASENFRARGRPART